MDSFTVFFNIPRNSSQAGQDMSTRQRIRFPALYSRGCR